jgi:hypothetical protein
LENGKVVQVTVVAGVDNQGILILLSKDAADVLLLSNQYTGKVRVMQPSDPLAFSPSMEGLISSGDPDYDLSAIAEADFTDETLADLFDEEDFTDETLADTFDEESFDDETSENPVLVLDDYDLVLIPAENRPPEEETVVIPNDAQIAPIVKEKSVEKDTYLDPNSFIDPVENVHIEDKPTPLKGFSVPILARMEKDKYYLQLRSYSKPELIESELTKIGKSRTLSIMITEVSGRTVYRILMGPLNEGESQTLQQQFRNKGWSDAFIWLGK